MVTVTLRAQIYPRRIFEDLRGQRPYDPTLSDSELRRTRQVRDAD